MNIELNDGRVLLKAAKEEEMTSGGIIIPGNANREQPLLVGEVVNAGQPRTDTAGKPTSIQFNKGDKVLYSAMGVTKVKVNKEEMILVRHEDIVARVYDSTIDHVYEAPTAVGR
jgi:chaperonin GroES